MGSSLSNLPNESIIDNKTQTTIVLMNRILNFILTQSDIKDMISLANPDTCSKWIVITETKISDLFDKIKIQPEIGKDGVLYLKKIDTLQKETKKDGLNQHYCKILAFFFIRMFQVVGALALSIIDTKLPDKDYSETSTKIEISESKGIPFFKKLKGGVLIGDEINSIGPFASFSIYFTKNGSYYLLNSFPSGPSKTTNNIPGITIKFNNNIMNVNYKQSPIDLAYNLVINGTELTLHNVERYYNGKQFITPFKEVYNFASQSSGKILVTDKSIDFADFILKKSQEIINLPKSNTIQVLHKFGYLIRSHIDYIEKIKTVDFPEENAGIFIEDNQKKEENPIFYFGFSKTVAGKLYVVNVQFNLNIIEKYGNYTVEISNLKNKSRGLTEFEPYLEDDNNDNNNSNTKESTRIFKTEYSREPVFGKTKQTIPQYLQKKFEKLIPQALKSMHENDFKRKEGYLAPVRESEGTENFLRTTDLWKTLLRDPPIKSFCVARALQLLNKSGLMKEIPQTIQPLIFNTKFALVANQSLPIPGQPITTAAPLKALETLYHDPKGLLKESKISSTKSLEKLIKSFSASESTTSIKDILELNGEKVPPFASALHKKKVNDLRLQASKLFNTHFDHVKKVNNLLNKIFILDKGPITLNPSILNKGVQGIEVIAHQARDLLTDYYSNCQSEYAKGVSILTSPDVIPKKLIGNSQVIENINRRL
jgi:hypothetical protein